VNGTETRDPTAVAEIKRENRVRVYRYGAREPLDVELVREQLRLAHQYRNVLVAIELTRRAEIDAALARLAPDLASVEREIGEPEREADPESGTPATEATGLLGEIAAAESAVRARRVKERGRPKDVGPLKSLRARLKSARARRKDLRAALFASPAWESERTRIEDANLLRCKAARAACGVYWGTYLAVETAARSFRRGPPPRFCAWRRRKDRLAVQIQGGLSISDLLSGEDTQARLVAEGRGARCCDGCRARVRRERRGQPEPTDARPCSCASLPPPSARRTDHATLWLRVGSTESSGPVWARVPIAYHRPMPPDARIKWIFLLRRSVGVDDVWSVSFVLERESWGDPERSSTGAVGIDVGWRRLEDGALRVAVWSGSDGREGEVALPAWWLREQRRVESIHGERDRIFDVARGALSAWLAGREGLTELLLEARKTLHAWRAQARLASLALRWRASRMEGDTETLSALESWRARDKHLLTFESHLRAQLQGSRRDLYRRVAADLSRRYATVVLEDMDLRTWHRLGPVEDGGSVEEDAARRYVRDACLSELCGAIEDRVREVRRVDPAGTTATCHACCRTQDVESLVHVCAGCGLRWDQDVNAARNLLAASGSVVSWGQESLAPVVRAGYSEDRNQRRRETEAGWAAARRAGREAAQNKGS